MAKCLPPLKSWLQSGRNAWKIHTIQLDDMLAEETMEHKESFLLLKVSLTHAPPSNPIKTHWFMKNVEFTK